MRYGLSNCAAKVRGRVSLLAILAASCAIAAPAMGQDAQQRQPQRTPAGEQVDDLGRIIRPDAAGQTGTQQRRDGRIRAERIDPVGRVLTGPEENDDKADDEAVDMRVIDTRATDTGTVAPAPDAVIVPDDGTARTARPPLIEEQETLIEGAPFERGNWRAYDPRYRARRGRQTSELVQHGTVLEGSVFARAQYDSNPRLVNVPDGAPGVASWGYEIEPVLSLTHRRNRTIVRGAARLSYNELKTIDGDSNLEDLSSFDQYGTVSVEVNGQRNRFTLFANVANATTRTELVEDTGVALTDQRSFTYGGGGSYTRTLGQSGEIQLFGGARRREIDADDLEGELAFVAAELEGVTGVGVNLTSYSAFEGGVDYKTQVSQRDKVGVAVTYDQFRPDSFLAAEADVISAFATWSRDTNSNVSFQIEAGPQYIMGEKVVTESTAIEVENAQGELEVVGFDTILLDKDDTNKITVAANAAVNYRFSADDRFVFEAGTSVEPSVLGQVRQNRRVGVTYERDMARDIILNVELSSIWLENIIDSRDTNPEVQQTRNRNRSLIIAEPELIWAVTPDWGVSAQYRFQREDEGTGIDGRSDVATSNAVMFSFSYLGTLLQ